MDFGVLPSEESTDWEGRAVRWERWSVTVRKVIITVMTYGRTGGDGEAKWYGSTAVAGRRDGLKQIEQEFENNNSVLREGCNSEVIKNN
jgi:hypothetical protein